MFITIVLRDATSRFDGTVALREFKRRELMHKLTAWGFLPTLIGGRIVHYAARHKCDGE